MFPRWSPTLLILLLTVGTSIVQAGAGTDAEPVQVFTNADLQRFGPPPASPSAPPASASVPGDDWAFVRQFLDRQYSRIDADRDHEAERARLEREATPPPVQDRGYLVVAPGAFHHGFPARQRPRIRPAQPPRRGFPHGAQSGFPHGRQSGFTHGFEQPGKASRASDPIHARRPVKRGRGRR